MSTHAATMLALKLPMLLLVGKLLLFSATYRQQEVVASQMFILIKLPFVTIRISLTYLLINTSEKLYLIIFFRINNNFLKNKNQNQTNKQQGRAAAADMSTGWRILATEQTCHDIPMPEVIEERVKEGGCGRGHSEDDFS